VHHLGDHRLAAVIGGERDAERARPVDLEVDGTVLIAERVPADDDGLGPARYQRGTFSITMGARKMVPPKIFRMAPLGEGHICLRSNSLARASSGVMVAHFTPTPCRWMACAESMVTWSSVASRFSMPRS
jgi:hypothetical protein